MTFRLLVNGYERATEDTLANARLRASLLMYPAWGGAHVVDIRDGNGNLVEILRPVLSEAEKSERKLEEYGP